MKETAKNALKIFLAGASGNVGRALVKATAKRDDFVITGGWCLEAGLDLGVLAGIGEIGVKASKDLRRGLTPRSFDFVFDFSSAAVMAENLSVYLDTGLNAVVGTTGLTEEEIASYQERVEAKGLRWSIIPNYGLGVALALDFLKKARRYYPYVAIIDHHTPDMANAPSGTAAMLAKAAAECAESSGAVKSEETYGGARGARICGVPVFSERLPYPSPYSGHTIKLAREDEVLTINVQDYTSEIYLDGIFLTAKKLLTAPAGTFLRNLSDAL